METISYNLLQTLKGDIDRAIEELDIPSKNSKLGELETISMEPDFWGNNSRAKNVLKEIEIIREEIKSADILQTTVNSVIELFNETPESDRDQLQSELISLSEKYNEFKRLKFLSGRYDKSAAIISIHAGQGGTEANDWAAMLQRMYSRLAERNSWKVYIEHEVPGTETGISTATLIIEGDYAFGLLKHEAGTHRLVRLSPFNAQSLRQTSFAGVEVMPVMDDEDIEIDIPESDIEFKAVRSGGPGGQNVNKTSSAVQIKHIPTGISVHCSTQRSQLQNRESAMKLLKAKLWRIEQDKRDDELRTIKGEHKIAGWGNQIRNYILHPYKLVKDLRTDYESTNPEAVLDGELNDFLKAQLLLNN